MQLIILLFTIQLSYGWDDPVTICWQGPCTKVYDDATPNTNACPTQPCRIEASHTFYQPFAGSSSKGKYFETQVACTNYGTMKTDYSVATCGVTQTDTQIDKKAKTILFFNGIQTASVKYGAGAAGSIPAGSTAPSLTDSDKTALAASVPSGSSCASSSSWTTTAFEYSHPTPVLGGEPINLKIRNRIAGGDQWEALWGLVVTCTDATCTDPNGCDYVPQTDFIHGTYCVSGLGEGYDGEYSAQEQSLVNGKHVFKKDNHQGVKFLVATGTAPGQGTDGWAIENDLGTPSEYERICVESINTPYDMPDLGFTGGCPSWRDMVGGIYEEVNVERGECEDHYTANIFGISDQTKTILMLVILSLSSCILGMMTLHCCQLVCNRKNNYRKVASKDIDIDF